MSNTETEVGLQKLSKKQLKALKFKAKTSLNAAEELKDFEESKENEKKRKLEEGIAVKEAAEAKEKEEADAPPKKKRKTRRGKKGKGNNKDNENSGPRFILFVGNLPFKTTDEDINTHFKNCKPTSIRLRTDKGCAFIEYKHEDPKESKRLMDIALRLHKSLLGGRKINVELTAGGGGNSKDRVEKIKAKNEKLEQERLTRLQAEKDKKAKADAEKAKVDGKEQTVEGGVHPDRAKMLGL
jgi:nucleolar protein 6